MTKTKINKQTLAQMLVFYAQDKERHHIVTMEPVKHDNLTDEENLDLWVCHASDAACTKIKKGKLEYGKRYLVSRGKELGFGLKPAVVLEYSNNWPWDFCYLYKY